MTKRNDTVLYYNRDNLATVHSAMLVEKQARIFYYNRGNQILDSIVLNPSKINRLLQQKTDVFFLYRFWLEAEKLNHEEDIKALRSICNDPGNDYIQYAGTKPAMQALLSQVKKDLRAVEQNIEQLSIPDSRAIATILHNEFKNAGLHYALLDALGIGYTTGATRGNKKYELTDHRGNIMAVISDRKKQVDNNGDGITDHYEADVISATDYYSSGMLMPGRQYQREQYPYSINGQEKSGELNDNLTTALYWEYDSRISRRWNTDPVVKIWQSPYEAFRDNPIVYTDPDGDDDIFDRNGKFLFSTKEGNAIRVINSGTTLIRAQKNPTANTKLLTTFSYFPANKANRVMLSAVATHYASKVGVTKDVAATDVSKENSGGLAFFDGSKHSYNIVVYNGKINSQAANAYNLMNSFVHEKVHEDKEDTKKPLNHTSAILAQIKDPTFDKTTTEFKRAAGTYAATLLTDALSKGSKLEDVKEKISQFNQSKLGTFSTLSYDEKTKSVSATALEEPVIIQSKPKRKT